ncbi:MAG: hypothetical protein ACO29X_01060 [Arcobacteraceae bacterium]|jgi:uncharacterized membrane protein
MALRLFLLSIIIVSFFLTDIVVKDVAKNDSKEALPKVSFINSTMYELNNHQVEKIVKSKQAIQYESKDELKDAVLILRGAKNTTDTISGKYMKRENNAYEFRKNIVFTRGEDMQLKTESLNYNDTTGIVSNNDYFVFNFQKSLFSGKKLYISKNDFAISGQQAHFVLNEKDL